ncbi:superfamily II RNA helicase [Encephalitozoon hellem]|nr:superfamily II RNA helicase [Encephalitozoon hellem]
MNQELSETKNRNSTDVENKGTEKKYYAMVKQDWIPSDYSQYVDEGILNIGFEADVFQKQAFYFLSRGSSVFVSAHTSSGKTLVAEYAISLSQKRGTRTIYTSPIKALSNQKYHDFKQKYDDVGIITGDVQVNPNAKCLVMTTEILRNLVYRNGDLLRDTEFVVFDEVHYINDSERGVVWEECIIMIPRSISFIMLSATIPNSLEFSEWVGRTKNRTIYVISTSKRAVPLEHVIYCDWNVYSIDEGGRTKGASNFKGDLVPFSKKNRPTGRFKILDLANFVVKKKLTPSIFFCFSKKRCEDYAEILKTLNLNDERSREEVRTFLSEATKCLSPEDRNLPQILSMSSMVLNGIAVHHGSLLPFVKECVELLFSMNLVKLLIATETFAMGVNMPAKCCVFLSLSKIDNGVFRYISSGEYIQMSGRAGRRGMDAVGTVVIADPKMPPLSTIRGIIHGTPFSLSSQFKLSFGLILISLRSNVKVEDLMRRSYGEHRSQRNYEKDMKKLSELERDEDKVCDVCGDLMKYIGAVEEICSKNWRLIGKHNVLREGTSILLKNNATGAVEKVCGSTVLLRLDDGVLSNNAPVPTKFLSHPLSIRKPLDRSKISLEHIFCVLDKGQACWDYNTTNVMDVLEIRRLKGLYDYLMSEDKKCKEFDLHYSNALKTSLKRREIDEIRIKYNVCSLGMIDEYNKRMEFLKRKGFVGEEITIKGRAAAEIHTVNEVLVVEMIFSNEFREMDGRKIISLMSSMIHEEADEQEPGEALHNECKKMKEYFAGLSRDLEELMIPPFAPLSFSLVDAVYEWCNGSSLAKIVSKYNVLEGTFVRLILRLEECCRELIAVSTMIGDKTLEEKVADASASMKKDIIFLPSLYL